MRIEIGMFSGRPDPGWEATAAERDLLSAALAGLVPVAAAAPSAPGLGYRGVTLVDGDRRVRVHAGAAETDEDGRRSRSTDPERRLERLVLRLARDHLPAGVLTALPDPDEDTP